MMFAAYKYVMVSVMLAEASFYSERLHLPLALPLQRRDLQLVNVDGPNIAFPGGLGGCVDISQTSIFIPVSYSFGFGTGTLLGTGELTGTGKFFGARFITKIHPFGDLHMSEENEMLSHGVSLIDTNEAYQLATNWLNAIQVNVQELEKTNHPAVEQRWYFSSQGITKLPVFFVKWGDWKDAIINIIVDGRTKDIVEIRQEHDWFSRRPAELVKNLDKLLEIPDEEFARYSESQRSNLVAQYAVVDYTHPADVPKTLDHRYDVTNDYELIFHKYSAWKKHNHEPQATNQDKATGHPH